SPVCVEGGTRKECATRGGKAHETPSCIQASDMPKECGGPARKSTTSGGSRTRCVRWLAESGTKLGMFIARVETRVAPCYSDSLIRRPAADCSGRAFIG